jgi:murein DD-endopeptidase MepM/ murein hydrolase activator NlpD
MPNNNQNDEKEFPNKGNFSASQNNVGKALNKNGYNQIQQQASKQGVKTAANAVAGPIGGAVADKVMDSKLGSKVTEGLSKASKSPLQRLGGFLKSKSEDEASVEQDEQDPLKDVKKKIMPIAILSGVGCLGSILLIAVLAVIILSPVFYMSDLIGNVKTGASNLWTSVVNFFRGCSSEEECQTKEQKYFYETIENTYNKYKGEPYYVTINTELLTATLTYYDPTSAINNMQSIEDLTDSIDYKKGTKVINKLVNQMVLKGERCYDLDNNLTNEYKNGEGHCNSDETIKVFYYYDEDNYKKYLEDKFIKEFYFNNASSEEINKQIPIIVEEIFQRAELVQYINSSSNTSNSYYGNSAQVNIYDDSGSTLIAQVSLFEYIQGAMYIEAGLSNPTEYKKAMAIVIKNYLYSVNRATKENMPASLSIKSSTAHQLWCSVTEGCHYMDDGLTLAPGADASGNYVFGAITNKDLLEDLNEIINETINEFVVNEDGSFVMTQYRTNENSCPASGCALNGILDQATAISMGSSQNYKEILKYYYNLDTEVITPSLVLPLDEGVFSITDEYGERTLNGVKNYHNGIDFGTLGKEGNNVYAVASGEVVEATVNSSCGCYIKIKHSNYYTRYLHLLPVNGECNFYVNVGDQVVAGQKIALSGGVTPPKGEAYGAHLHFDYYIDEKTRANPRLLLGSLLPSE